MKHQNDAHPPLIEALLDPHTYDHPVEDCRLIETHISWVILTGKYVYKIKKPVDLGFLDFTSLDKRHYYCQEELRLNSRLAPDIYLSVVPISGTPQQPSLNGQGDVFEYAVKMREFPQAAQMDRMHARGQLRERHLDALARLVADFHQHIKTATEDSVYGDPQHVFQPVLDTLASFRAHTHAPPIHQTLDTLNEWCHTHFERLKPQLIMRKKSGYIRECHGDMHLRNLAWVNDAAVVFDCIEFNPNLSWIDVMSEVAFLVMDLDDRQLPGFAQRFLNAYLEHTGDYAGMGVFRFYLVYRALVRGMVAAIRADQTGITTKDKHAAEKEIHEYLELARNYTKPSTTPLIIARGPSGSGKTTLTQPLLEQLGAIRMRSDIERKRLYGLKPEESGQAAFREGIYTADASERTYNKLAELAEQILDAGYPVIIDATCQKHEQRLRFQQLANRKQLPYIILEFTASPESLRRRITARQHDASDADLAVLEHQLDKWQPLLEPEKQHCLYIDTEKPFDAGVVVQEIQSRHLPSMKNARPSKRTHDEPG